jgi:hypothetical protein
MLEIGLICAIIGYVYSSVLTEPKMLLNKPYLFLERVFPEFIFSPIIGCFRCVSGQIALWTYLFIHKEYLWYKHILLVCLSILLSVIIDKIYRECRN